MLKVVIQMAETLGTQAHICDKKARFYIIFVTEHCELLIDKNVYLLPQR